MENNIVLFYNNISLRKGSEIVFLKLIINLGQTYGNVRTQSMKSK